MASDEQLNILVRVAADESSARRAAATVATVGESAAELRDDFNRLSPATAGAVRDIERGFDDLRSTVSHHRADIEDLRDEYLMLADYAERADAAMADALSNRAPSTGGVGGTARGGVDLNQARREGVGDLSTTFGALASVGGGEIAGIIGDVTGFIEYLPTVGQSLTALGPAGIVAVAGSVAVVAAFGAVADAYDKTAESARNLINTQEDYYNTLSTATTEDLEARIEEQRRAVEVQRQIFNELNNVVETGYQQTSQTLGVFTDTLLELTNAGGARELRNARDEEAASLREQEFLLARLEAARSAESIATNDAAAAAERAAEAERELAQARDSTLIAFVQTQIAADQLTADQRADRIAQIQRELAAYQTLVDGGQLTEEGLTQVEQTMQSLNTEMSILQYTFESSADAAATAEAAIEAAAEAEDMLSQIRQKNAARDAEKAAAAAERVTTAQDALNAAYDQQFDALELVAEASANVTQAQQAYDQSLVDTAQKIEQITARAGEREIELRTQTDTELAKLQADAGDDRVKAEEDLAKAIRQAQNQYLRDYGRAVANRDVEAATRAKETFKDQQTSANTAYQEQLQAIDTNLVRQTQVIKDRYDEQLNTLRRESERQISEARAAGQRETEVKRLALAQARVDLQNAQNAQRAMEQQYQLSLRTLQQQEQSARLIAQQAAGQQSVQIAQQYGLAAGMAFAQSAKQGMTGGLGGIGTGAYGGQGFPQLNAIPTTYTTQSGAGRTANTFNIYSGSDTRTIRDISNSQAATLLRQVLVD